jgi:RND family efflux transporter MFP subunit
VPLFLLAILGIAGWVLWPRIQPMLDRWRAPEVEGGVVIRTRPGSDLELTTASGYVVPRTKAALAAKVAGTLTHLMVDVGDEVEANALIAQIEKDDWEHRKDQQLAEVARAMSTSAIMRHRVLQAQEVVDRMAVEAKELDAALREAGSVVAEAQRVYDLEKQLFDSGSGKKDDSERANNELVRTRASLSRVEQSQAIMEARKKEAELAVKEASLAVAQADVGVTRAQADLASAVTDLKHTEIRAPFAGTILRKEAEVGEIVVPALAGGSTSRGSVVTMADFKTLELEVDVFERDIRLVTEGGPAEIRINALPNLVFEGRVRQVVPTADRAKGTVQVKVSLMDSDPRVLPEMAGKVVFLKDAPEAPRESQVMAPTAALTRRNDQIGVFLLEGDRVKFQAVTTGPVQSDRTTILSGLLGGERVVINPQSSLADLMQVRLKESSNG